VSAQHALNAEVRLYDHLFKVPAPEDVPKGVDYKTNLNPESLVTLKNCKLEPSLATAAPGARMQFERVGYFCVDTVDSKPGAPVFNRTVSLRDSWAKQEKKG
jgi:glutaminyl-tRNA synthetase